VRFVAFTDRTIRSRAELDAELKRIRRQGFARDDQEHEEGVRCIGAPILDHTGAVVAALSAAWPDFRYKREEEAKKTSMVVSAAARISAILGWNAE